MEGTKDTPTTLIDFIEPTYGKWEVIEDEEDGSWTFLCDGEEKLYTCHLPMVQDALTLFLSHAKQRREEALRVLTHQPDNIHALHTLINTGKDLREIRHYQMTLAHERLSMQAGR